MAKRTIGFEDYQPSQYEEYTGEAPPPNQWFTGEVVRATYLEEDDQVRFIVELVDHPDYAGWGKGWYAPFEGNMKWKMHEILRAIQGGQEKAVSLDWEKEAEVKAFLRKGKRIRFQTEDYNGDIKIRKVRPLLEQAGKPATGTKAAPPKAAPAPAPEPEADAEAIEDYTEAELDDLSIDELKGILGEEFEADVPAKGRREKEEDYKNKLIDAILDAQESEDADGENPDDGDGDFEDDFDDTDDNGTEPDPEPEPEPAPTTRRRRGAAAPAPEPEPAPVARATRRRRG